MHKGKVVALARRAELKASIGKADATLDDVFIHYTGSNLESGGNYRETQKNARSARRLG